MSWCLHRKGRIGAAFATGIRNCVGLAVHPDTGDVYCSTNERDGLGDNLVPDYVTRVREGEFFGWPWRYMGDHEDPRWKGSRPDLAGKVANPDVLIQPHSAPLGMTFYTGTAFPSRLSGLRLRRAARLLEPSHSHRLQGCAHYHARWAADRRL